HWNRHECPDQEHRFNELQEKLLILEKNIGYLLPPADLLLNFALKSLGAKIVHLMTSDTYQSKDAFSFFGFLVKQPAISPDIVIQGRSHPLPGRCWPFEGSKGRISISLPNNVLISHVSLSHIPKRISIHGTISFAPKEFSVYGRKDLESEESLLGTFLYDEDGDQLQIFKLPDYVAGSFRYITLQVKSNWGNPDYTCLYGFRVHGKLEK
uniref:SUN domain-containing protein n=1 Tax=Cyprinodon variegatus TaxID=28743 RepID=A0A3Q2DF69_CYPVA